MAIAIATSPTHISEAGRHIFLTAGFSLQGKVRRRKGTSTEGLPINHFQGQISRALP